MEPDLASITRGAITCMSCHDRLTFEDDSVVAQAGVTAFIAAHTACPDFRITLTLNLSED